MTPLQALDLEIQNSKDSLKVAQALERLSKNKDYNLVIGQVYLTDEVLRLNSLMASPEYEGKQEGIIARLNAISHFGQFLHFMRLQADALDKSIKVLEDAREELVQEELEND